MRIVQLAFIKLESHSAEELDVEKPPKRSVTKQISSITVPSVLCRWLLRRRIRVSIDIDAEVINRIMSF